MPTYHATAVRDGPCDSPNCNEIIHKGERFTEEIANGRFYAFCRLCEYDDYSDYDETLEKW